MDGRSESRVAAIVIIVYGTPASGCVCGGSVGGVFVVSASILHLLMLCVHYVGPSANLLCILLLNYFFGTQSLLLICCCNVSAKNCRSQIIWVGRGFCCCWFLFAFVRLYTWFMRRLVHVLCTFFSFCRFFDKMCPNMMCREISRPPRSTNHTCLRPPVPNLPRFRDIVHPYTHTHPCIPIYTHLHLIYVN